MAKWADYLISCCGYKDNHIEEAGVHEDLGEKLGSRSMRSRSWILDRMDNRYSFCTITKGGDGQWRKGARVNIVTVMGVRYLRTDANYTESDNLGALPKC